MITSKRLNLNLATHPLRNRRFFYSLLWLLAISLVLISYPAARAYVKYRGEAQKVITSMANIEQQMMIAATEEKNFREKIEEARRRDKEKVDLVNSIILKKVFSWTELLSTLESSLPDSSYILSLAPNLADDSSLQVRLVVASQSLDRLVEFLNKLRGLKFKIKIIGEMNSEKGLLISDVSLSYERAI